LEKLILIVEDDDVTLKLLRDILLVYGYRVIETTDGREAIERIAREKPDLVTLDIYLHGMNGLEVCRAIKSNPETNKIPVIAITASAMQGQDQTALEAGFDEIIKKPFDIDTLIKKVEMIMSNKSE